MRIAIFANGILFNKVGGAQKHMREVIERFPQFYDIVYFPEPQTFKEKGSCDFEYIKYLNTLNIKISGYFIDFSGKEVSIQDIIALLIKIFRRKMRLYGPAYHMPPRSKSPKKFIQYLPHYLDYELGIWFMSFTYTKIYTENLYMKNYFKSLNSKVDVIVESPGIKCKFIKPFSSTIIP